MWARKKGNLEKCLKAGVPSADSDVLNESWEIKVMEKVLARWFW